LHERVACAASGPSRFLLRLVLCSALATACLFPPEARGESAAGCAALLTLLAIVLSRRLAASPADLGLCVAFVVAAPMVLSATAPGAAVEPLAVFLLAAGAGALAASRPSALREGAGIAWVLAAVGGLVSLQALYQGLHGLDALAASVERANDVPDAGLVVQRLREGRAFGPFATPAALGGFLSMVLPVTVGLAASRKGIRRVGPTVLAALACVALAASASATAAASLGAAVLLFAARRGHVSRRAVLSVGAGFLVLGAAIVALRGSRVVDPTNPEGPWRLRTGNLRVAAEMFRDHPATGVGPGGFAESFPAYRRAGDSEARHAHNLPMELLAEVGLVPGGLLSLLFLVLFSGPVLRRAELGPGWMDGARVGLAAFALHNLADFTAFFPSLLWTAAILRGALAREDSGAPFFSARFLSATRTAVILVAGTAVALSGIARNRRLEARYLVLAGARERARELAGEARTLAPWNVDGRMLYAQTLLDEIGPEGPTDPRFSTALHEVEQAVRLSPVRPSARALRARVRLRLGDTPGAYADLCEAARAYPIHEGYGRERDALAERLPGRRRDEADR